MPKAKGKYELHAEDRTEAGLSSARARLRRFSVAGLAGVAAAAAGVWQTLKGWSQAIADGAREITGLKAAAADLQTTIAETAAIRLFAAEQDASFEQVASAIERIKERLGEAKEEGGQAAELFREIGINLDELGKRGGLTQLVTVLHAIGRLDPARQARVRAELVGGGTGRLAQGDYIGAARRAGAAVPEGIEVAAGNFDRIADAWERIWDRKTLEIGTQIGDTAATAFVARILERAAERPTAQPQGSTSNLERELEQLNANIARLNAGVYGP